MGLRNRTQLQNEQCFFVTTTCYKWFKLLESDAEKQVVADSLNFLCIKYKCHLLAYVIMPNHIHLVIYFPEENRLSDYMRDLKKFTSVKLRQLLQETRGIGLLESLRYESRLQKFKVWMDRFDDVVIIKADLLRIKIDYIHNNPLQTHWQLVQIPGDYRYSSAAFYEDGIVGPVTVTNYGEFMW